MDTLLTGLKVALIGMLIVFFGLTILIGLIKTLTTVTDPQRKKDKQKNEKKPAEETETAVAETEEYEDEDDGPLVAAITAALYQVLGNDSKFTVRHIRRIAR